jgi:AraC-like DNA-binding protein
MSGAGAARFDDLDDYQARLTLTPINFVITEPGTFDASLTWVKFPNVLMLDMSERLARVAYIALPTNSVFVSFVKHPGKELIWNGIHVPYGDIILHACEETFHQRVTSFSHWGFVALASDFLRSYGQALAGQDLPAANLGQILRPAPKLSTCLLRFHARLARIAQTRAPALMRQELARSIEQELLSALVPCLTEGNPRRPSQSDVANMRLMARFENLVLDRESWTLPVPELHIGLRTSAQRLRSCSLEVLGTTPGHYLLLRRLHLVRMAIRRDTPGPRTPNDIAGDFGFTDPARFSDEYFEAFGETPIETQRRPRSLVV